MKKRALVIGMGGLRGAYDAGVAAELCRNLGPDYFDTIYACSAGVYVAAYFVAGQPDYVEHVWRNNLDGNKLVNFFNPISGRDILDLEYLTYLMHSHEMLLETKKLPFGSGRLIYILTNRKTGQSVYIEPTKEQIFALMNASSALPFLHPPITIDGVAYIDGSLSDPLPFAKALADGHDEVVVVYNKPEGFFVGSRYDTFSHLLALGLPRQVGKLVKNLKFRFQDIERELIGDPRLKVIRPKVQLPLKSILDTNKARLNACVDMGIADAKEFLKTYHG